MDIQRFNLDGHGLTRVLGELAAPIMEAVWKDGAVTIKAICATLGPDANYKTVLTVTNRLVEKGLLTRQRLDERAYVYRATVSREAFLGRIMASVATGLVGDFGRQALAHLVQAADEVDPTYLDELERLVRERKGGRP